MPVPSTIVCVDCGGPCQRTPLDDPPDGWNVGDIASYRCRDCLDVWYVEIAPEDVDDGGSTSDRR